MPPQKQTKILTRRRKFISVDVPEIRLKIEMVANSPNEIVGRNAKIDLTRHLKGKSVEAQVPERWDLDACALDCARLPAAARAGRW